MDGTTQQMLGANTPVPLTPELQKKAQETTKKWARQQLAESQQLKQMESAIPPIPETPKQDGWKPEQAQAFFPLMMALGAIAGRGTSQPMVAAMNNMNAVMQGKMKGEEAVSKAHEAEMWKNYDAAMKAHDEGLKKLDAHIKAVANDPAGGREGLRLALLEQLSPQQADQMSDPKLAFQYAESRRKMAESLNKQSKTMREGMEQFDQNQIKADAAQIKAGVPITHITKGMGKSATAYSSAVKNEAVKQLMEENNISAEQAGSELAMASLRYHGSMSEEAATGRRLAGMETAAVEAKKVIPQALEASNAFSRTEFVPFNKAIAMVEAGTGDTKISDFVAANNAVINTYARAISPVGAPTVSDKEHAREVLNTAQTKEQYATVLKRLEKEIDAAISAPAEIRKHIEESVSTSTAHRKGTNKLPEGVKLSPGIHTDSSGNKIEVFSDGTYREM